MNVSCFKNYSGIFRESLAKVLLKPWRKMAFLRKLGGLNCVDLLCQNWPMKVSKDQHLKAERKCLSAAAQNEVWQGIRLRRLEQSEDITLPCFSSKSWPKCTAKDKHGVRESSAKENFFLAKMAFSRWKNLEQPSYIFKRYVSLSYRMHVEVHVV